jgi:mRNA interferase MazF
MRRGDLYWVNFEPSSPPEFGKVRPAVIVSSTDQNLLLPTLVVVPLSTKAPAIWPLRIAVNAPYPKLKESYAVLPGIRQVSVGRLSGRIGAGSIAFIRELDNALIAYLS